MTDVGIIILQNLKMISVSPGSLQSQLLLRPVSYHMPTSVGPRGGAVSAEGTFLFHGGCSCMENLRQLSGRHGYTLSGIHYPAMDAALLTKQEKDKNQ